MIYLLCFAVSTYFVYKACNTKSKKHFIYFSIISISIMILLAGLRDYSIGIDVENYLNWKAYWVGAVESESLFRYMQLYHNSGFSDYLSAFFMGIIAQTTGSFRLYLFATHVIIMIGVYVGAYRMRKHANPAFVMLLFYLCFYSHSLNVMRQYMAMALIFAFLADLEENKYLRYTLIVFIAILIHNTAILALGALVIHWVLYGKIPRINPTLRQRKIFIVAGLSCLVLGFEPLCRVAITMGVLSKKYLFYLETDKIEYGLIVTVLLIMELVGVYLLWKELRRKDACIDFFLMNSCAYLILYQLTGIIPYGKRVAGYFCLTNLVTLAMLAEVPKTEREKRIVRVIILGCVLLYWFYVYVFRQASGTYPYAALGIIFY